MYFKFLFHLLRVSCYIARNYMLRCFTHVLGMVVHVGTSMMMEQNFYFSEHSHPTASAKTRQGSPTWCVALVFCACAS